jgi:hypothetical protein
MRKWSSAKAGLTNHGAPLQAAEPKVSVASCQRCTCLQQALFLHHVGSFWADKQMATLDPTYLRSTETRGVQGGEARRRRPGSCPSPTWNRKTVCCQGQTMPAGRIPIRQSSLTIHFMHLASGGSPKYETQRRPSFLQGSHGRATLPSTLPSEPRRHVWHRQGIGSSRTQRSNRLRALLYTL